MSAPEFLESYVGVPAGHRLFGLDYTAEALEQLDCHGGLTFAAPCQDGAPDHRQAVCHLSDTGPVWWFGFDTAHAFDFCPGMAEFRGGLEVADYRTLEYVVEQVTQLAAQVVEPEG